MQCSSSSRAVSVAGVEIRAIACTCDVRGFSTNSSTCVARRTQCGIRTACSQNASVRELASSISSQTTCHSLSQCTRTSSFALPPPCQPSVHAQSQIGTKAQSRRSAQSKSTRPYCLANDPQSRRARVVFECLFDYVEIENMRLRMAMNGRWEKK